MAKPNNPLNLLNVSTDVLDDYEYDDSGFFEEFVTANCVDSEGNSWTVDDTTLDEQLDIVGFNMGVIRNPDEDVHTYRKRLQENLDFYGVPVTLDPSYLN